MSSQPVKTDDAITTARVEAFSDGVFAIAITLLVLNITVPQVSRGGLSQALLNQWPDFAAYAVSFLTIGIIWVNHHATFTRIARVDRPLLFINLFLLMTVSFIPFPTRLLSLYLQNGQDARVAAFVYAGTMTAMSIGFSGIWMYAVYRGLLRHDGSDPQQLRSTIPRFGAGLLVYAGSMGVALISPKASLALFALLALFYVFDQQAGAESGAKPSGLET